jgi:hypothetical protein
MIPMVLFMALRDFSFPLFFVISSAAQLLHDVTFHYCEQHYDYDPVRSGVGVDVLYAFAMLLSSWYYTWPQCYTYYTIQ